MATMSVPVHLKNGTRIGDAVVTDEQDIQVSITFTTEEVVENILMLARDGFLEALTLGVQVTPAIRKTD